MGILITQQPVLPTDNFSQWAEKINNILAALQISNISTDEAGYVTLSSSQNIIGSKTFASTLTLNAGINSNGNFIFGGPSGTINSTTLTINSSQTTLVGANGIALKSNINESAISLKFAAGNAPNRLIFDYEHPTNEGELNIAEGNLIRLCGSSPSIILGGSSATGLGGTRWNLPTDSPSVPSVLKWEASNNNVSWTDYDSLGNDISQYVVDAIATAGLTPLTPLIPIGVTVDIDATALTSWTTLKDDIRFPGWLKCNGAQISKVTNPEFTELIRLLNDGNTSLTTATLPNNTGKLIKYKEDPVTTFKLEDGAGIQFSSGSTLLSDISIGSSGGTISLYTNPDHFEYETGLTVGRLRLKNLSSAAVPSSIAQRTSAGNLIAAAPTASDHLTTKSYVDSIATQTGNVSKFPELIDGVYYNDTEYSLTIIDKLGNCRGFGDINNARGMSANDNARADIIVNTFSPITDKRVKAVKCFSSPAHYFFEGDDGVLYGNGSNTYGVMGSTQRGAIAGPELEYFSSVIGNSQPYTTNDGVTLPALLPSTDWPAHAISFDYATGLTGSTSLTQVNVTVKTKDGYDRVLGPDNDFIKYFVNGVAWTRGHFISAGSNNVGQLGRGDIIALTAASGPVLWGASQFSPGRALWAVYSRKDSDPYVMNAEQLHKASLRFHCYKPNVIQAAGESAWRNATGLTSGEPFSDFSWYIKKVIRTKKAHYVIVGKPGTELSNECWVSGGNNGNLGNGSTSGDSRDFVRVCNAPVNLGTAAGLIVGGNGVYNRSDGAPHGFRNLERLSNGTTHYYIVRGTGLTNSLNNTHFRLFANSHDAVNAILNPGSTTGIALITNPQSILFSYRSRYTGIYDMVVGIMGDNDYVIAKVALTESTNPSALDALPESSILTNALVGWGENSRGAIGVGDETVRSSPTNVSYEGTIGSSKVLEISASNRHSQSFMRDSSGNLWYTGRRDLGLSGINLSGNSVRWTKVPISNQYDVKRFFFIEGFGAMGGTNYSWPRIFVVATKRSDPTKTYLYASGYNRASALGTNVRYDEYTPNYLRIPFPEDPMNIVSMTGVHGQTLALCKDSPSSTNGRMYMCGFDNGVTMFSTTGSGRQFPFFRNVDQFIL